MSYICFQTSAMQNFFIFHVINGEGNCGTKCEGTMYMLKQGTKILDDHNENCHWNIYKKMVSFHWFKMHIHISETIISFSCRTFWMAQTMKLCCSWWIWWLENISSSWPYLMLKVCPARTRPTSMWKKVCQTCDGEI